MTKRSSLNHLTSFKWEALGELEVEVNRALFHCEREFRTAFIGATYQETVIKREILQCKITNIHLISLPQHSFLFIVPNLTGKPQGMWSTMLSN